jgi:hypothetical protein
MRMPSKRVVLLLAVLPYLWLGAQPFFIVLCIGADGHFALEAVHPDGSATPHQEGTDCNAVLSPSHFSCSCGVCYDLPVGGNTGKASITQTSNKRTNDHGRSVSLPSNTVFSAPTQSHRFPAAIIARQTSLGAPGDTVLRT